MKSYSVKGYDDKALEVSLLGSCLTNFVVNHHLVHEARENNLSIKIVSQVLQQRSDVIVDLLNGIKPDVELIKYYLTQGDWDSREISVNGKKIKYAKWFTNHLVQKIKGANKINVSTGIIVIDSLSDIRHSVYRHRHGWKTMLGKIKFKDQSISRQFNEDFEF